MSTPRHDDHSQETTRDHTAPARVQRHGRVVLTLDGDAFARVWEPNTNDDPIDVDLLPHVAALIDLGLDAAPAPEPHWTDQGGRTLIISMSPGTLGSITINGFASSPEAATRLLADGFVECLRRAVTTDAVGDQGDQPAAATTVPLREATSTGSNRPLRERDVSGHIAEVP